MQEGSGSAASRYTELETARRPYLDRARSCSKFTLPALVPPEGWTGASQLPEPWNNLGARGVNNLSSKLVLTLFPPGASFFRNDLDAKTRSHIEQRYADQPEAAAQVFAQIDTAMSEVEKRSTSWMEANQVRVSLGEALKHLIVAGNVLLLLGDDGVRVFRLDKYVVLRDSSGRVLEVIVKEEVSRAALPKRAKAVLAAGRMGGTSGSLGDIPQTVSEGLRQAAPYDAGRGNETADKTVSLYTQVTLSDTGRLYKVRQEISGATIPGSEGSYPVDKIPWLPLRWTKIDGEDYGWGHVDSFMGDLSTLDMLSQALTEGASIAARVIFLKQPGSVGKTSDLAKAANGAFVAMDHAAVKALTLDKYADFRVALERVNDLEKTISFAFLLNTAIQRAGERVTAEEIRYMARELEDALGGVYSVLAQELQLPLARRILFVMTRQKEIPPLPPEVVPVIITGINGLGRGNDLERLNTFLQTLAGALGPEAVPKYVNPDEYARRAAVAMSIDTKGLIKSPEQIAQEQQQSQMQQLIQQLGPDAVKQMGAMGVAHANNSSKEAMQASAQAHEKQQQEGQQADG